MGKMGMGKEGMQGTGRNASVSTSLPKAKIQGAKVGLFFSSHSSFFFNYLSSYNVFPVSEQVSVTASVTVINKVVVAGLLWDRWGSIWDLYIFQVKEA